MKSHLFELLTSVRIEVSELFNSFFDQNDNYKDNYAISIQQFCALFNQSFF